MKEIEMDQLPSWLPCPRCGLLPPDPDPTWTGARAGTCPCRPSRGTAAVLARRVQEQHACAVRRALAAGSRTVWRRAAA